MCRSQDLLDAFASPDYAIFLVEVLLDSPHRRYCNLHPTSVFDTSNNLLAMRIESSLALSIKLSVTCLLTFLFIFLKRAVVEGLWRYYKTQEEGRVLLRW